MMRKAADLLKKTVIFLIKAVYIGSFFVLSIWLLKMLYFPDMKILPEHEPDAEPVFAEYAHNEEMLEERVRQMKPGHFHITDEYVFHLESDPPFCMTCHGVYPHIRNKKTMSFLNLHAGFMACEICHIHKASVENKMYFAWADLETGEATPRAEGGYGKYNAKIVPMITVDRKPARLDRITSGKFSGMYQKLMDGRYSSQLKEEEAKKIHTQSLSGKAVTCLECHRKKGYIDFRMLGFPQSRVNQLTSSEVSRMVEHYETFFMPRMLMPR